MSYLEQLFITRSHRYFVLTLFVFGLVGLLCGYLWLDGERQQYRYLQQHHAQLRQQLVTMQQTVSQLPAFAASTVAFAAPLFSVVETLRQSRGQLLHWQPNVRQARLELSVAWERVPSLFAHIAKYRGLTLSAFHIKAAAEAMAVVLVLEFSYENL